MLYCCIIGWETAPGFVRASVSLLLSIARAATLYKSVVDCVAISKATSEVVQNYTLF